MRKRKTLLWDADAGVSISAEFTASGPVTYHGVEHTVGQRCWPLKSQEAKREKESLARVTLPLLGLSLLWVPSPPDGANR